MREGEAEDASFELTHGAAERGLVPSSAAEELIDLRRSQLLRATQPGSAESEWYSDGRGTV